MKIRSMVAAVIESFSKPKTYEVSRQEVPIIIDGNWEKPDWKKTVAAQISNCMGAKPEHMPSAQVKVKYDEDNLYVIFRVKEKNVRNITDTMNGPVWDDSCVEFFFSPDPSKPGKYFNLEINCGGVALMHYNLEPRVNFQDIDVEDLKRIEIAHSLPKINDPEIEGPVTWTIEFKLPFDILQKYAEISLPHPGMIWIANFYKTATITSNPHYITWSFIDRSKPDFHVPEYFGRLIFK